MTNASPPLDRLGRLPRLRATHHWADYVELLSLVNVDGRFSVDDLVERWKEQHDLESVDDSNGGEEDPVDAPGLEPGAPAAAVDDRRYQRARDVFAHLAYRAQRFEESYPFDLPEYGSELVRVDDLDQPQRLYVFLLLASSLRYVPKARRHSVTQPFELMAAEVMRLLMPPTSEVHVFGTAQPQDGRYSGTMWEKINTLASDLGETVILSEDAFAATDTGDLGLDVVAWVPLGDGAPSLPVWFVQATCEAEWKAKQHESGGNWHSYITTRAPRGNVLVVPYCFRSTDGSWFDAKWPTAAVLVDRQRLCWLFRNHGVASAAMPEQLIEEALQFREPV
jgi:hypothetical protein